MPRRLPALIAGIVAAALLGVFGGSAQAQRASLLLYGGAEQPETDEEVLAALSAVLGANEIEGVDAFAEARRGVEEGAVPEQDLSGFARAGLLLEEGWRSYQEVRASFAAARLAEARTVALGVAHLQGGKELLAEVSLKLGVAKLDLERQAEAADDFRLSHALAPERVVDDSEFKPEAVAAYKAAIEATRSSQKRPLLLDPRSAELIVDGRAIEASPQLELADGLHLIAAGSPGYRSRAQLVSVSPGGDAPLTIKLDPEPAAARVLRGSAALARGVSEREAEQVASALLLYAEVDELYLLASVWRRGSPALLGQRCAGAPVRCASVVEIGYPEGGLLVAAEELWRKMRSAPARFPPTLQIDARVVAGEKPPGSRPIQHTPFWKNRWLWVGVAAASLAGGALYLLSGDEEITPLFTGDACDFGGC